MDFFADFLQGRFEFRLTFLQFLAFEFFASGDLVIEIFHHGWSFENAGKLLEEDFVEIACGKSVQGALLLGSGMVCHTEIVHVTAVFPAGVGQAE